MRILAEANKRLVLRKDGLEITAGEFFCSHGDKALTSVSIVLKESLTELEVGVAGTDVVTPAEDTLHHQSYTQGVVQAEVLGYAVVLKTYPKQQCRFTPSSKCVPKYKT